MSTHAEYLSIFPARRINARIILPASKSISNRALIINALSHNPEVPYNLSDCDDTRAIQDALHFMPEVIDIGAAGTAMRFLTAYLAVTPGTHILTGSERMCHRPIGILVEALRQLGANVEYTNCGSAQANEGYPPLLITGNPNLQGGELSLPGNVSSQFISALLMIAPMLANGLRLTLTTAIVSRPYLDMTVTMMREFGADVVWEAENTLRIAPRGYQPRPYTIENDWSAASYWYEIMALSNDANAEITLPGLHQSSMQGDCRVCQIYEELGVVTEYIHEPDGMEGIRLKKTMRPTCLFRYDFSCIPDLAQTVAVTCAMLEIPFELYGLQTLRIKETDRIYALQRELDKLGFSITGTHDTLSWEGYHSREEEEMVYEIDTYDDHRMAMAFAPACLQLHGLPLRIAHPEVVSKSYPAYWEDLKKAGFYVI